MLKSNIESLIENKEIAPEQLPDNSQIQQEAKQLYDSKPNNDEVDNDAVEEFIKQEQTIDWDKVKVYGPNEDPYFKVSDESDWKNNPDHEPDFIEIKDKKDDYQKDEDFLGPDEYIDENGNIQVDPNWKPENADEDFVGPDEQLAIVNSELPAEIKNESTFDTSDYNFDWDYDIQTLGVKSPEEILNAPVTNVEQAKSKQRLMNWLKSHGHGFIMPEPSVSNMPSEEATDNKVPGAGRAAGSSLLGNIGNASGLSYTAPNVQSLNKEDKHGGPTNSTASGSVELPNSEKPTERTMSLSTINSGETMFGKSGMLGRADLNKGGEIKVGQSDIKADFTGHTSKPEELAPKPIGGSSNQIYTDLITQILRKFPNGYSDNQITITVNGQNVLVNGKQLGQLSDIELQTLKEVL